MIRTEALTKFYGSRCAVRDLSVSIEDREIVGFLGLNGAGKTTTLRMLAGLLAPSSGRIEIDGQDMLATAASGLRYRIGFLPEQPPLYDDMDITSYLLFAAQLRGCAPERAKGRVAEVIDLTDLGAYRDELITNLSHGYRQRVGIAQAIVHDPPLVILDEPTGGLDPVQIVEMRNLISDLKARHTVLLSSHNLPEIRQTCDRLMVIRAGELVAVGSEEELAQSSKKNYVADVTGEESAIRAAFTKADSEGLVSDWSMSAEDSGYLVTLKLGDGQAPEALTQAVFTAGLGLRRFQPTAGELESLFMQLTKEAA